MPYSIEISLCSESTLKPKQFQGINRNLQALFMKWLSIGDDQLAQEIHYGASVKPYTISPAMLDETGKFVFYRITLLDDKLWPTFETGINNSGKFFIRESKFNLHSYSLDCYDTYDMLVSNSRADSNFIIRFLSPTAFRKMMIDYPLPDIGIVFRSLIYRWNSFAPSEMMIDLALSEMAADNIAIYRAESSISPSRYGRRSSITGLTGKVEYRVVNRKSTQDFCKAINTLIDYSYYSGVGTKTTVGFGQIKRMEKWVNAKFFISYSSIDAYVANQISIALQKSGFNTWLDQKDIVIGQPIVDRLGKGISDESDYVIILISQNSLVSEWCKLELAMAYQKELEQKRIVLLPVLIDESDIPIELRTKKYYLLDTDSDESLDSMVEEISTLVNIQSG